MHREESRNESLPRRRSSAVFRAAICSFLLLPPSTAVAGSLFQPAELVAPPSHIQEERWRPVRVDGEALAGGEVLRLELFDGEHVQVRHRRTISNASGSFSWIGDVELRATGDLKVDTSGLVVLVHRQGVTIGSIRLEDSVFMLAYAGEAASGVHVLYEVDEGLPKYRELEPTVPEIAPRLLEAAKVREQAQRAGEAPADDGSIQDLMVVYTERARDEVGGQVAIENLIDLGVTETNMSYETSGVAHRLRLVRTHLTDYDEMSGLGCPRDLLQDPDDGVMDEVHAIRDQAAADLVKLIVDGNGCGRAFIMNEISTAHAEFAFCFTNHVCVSPGYTFQHELGHIQSGRHQRTAPQPDSPFTFNFGFTDPVNEFRTIMAAGDQECPDGCPRRLAWSNPDVLDDESGTPMGIPEGEELPADMRKALNATAWVVANFRVSGATIFADGFESGDTGAWSELVAGD